MKLVILATNQIYSNKVVKELVKEYKSDIRLIIESGHSKINIPTINFVRKYISTSGWKYVFIQTIKLEIYKLLSFLYTKVFQNDLDSKFYSYSSLAKKKKIELITSSNINSKNMKLRLNNLKPDLIISVYFNQIIDKDFIRIPKYGVINIHPAYLPKYRGVSPVFWALNFKEKEAGVTIHFIDIGVDTGKIIKREKIKIEKDDTEDSLYWKLTKVGIPLLISTVRSIKRIKTINNKGGTYFTIPNKIAVRKYLKERKAFFRLKDYLFLN